MLLCIQGNFRVRVVSCLGLVLGNISEVSPVCTSSVQLGFLSLILGNFLCLGVMMMSKIQHWKKAESWKKKAGSKTKLEEGSTEAPPNSSVKAISLFSQKLRLYCFLPTWGTAQLWSNQAQAWSHICSLDPDYASQIDVTSYLELSNQHGLASVCVLLPAPITFTHLALFLGTVGVPLCQQGYSLCSPGYCVWIRVSFPFCSNLFFLFPHSTELWI